VLRDIRFALKLLWKDRGFAATAILTLAVCIGSNTAIFTIVNSALLRPLAAPEADRILLMANQYPNAGTGTAAFSNSGVPDYYDRLRDVRVFEEQAMYNFTSLTIEINETPERVRGMNATPSLFRLLRAAPVLGRAFDVSEGEVGAEQKVILSDGLWRQLFGTDWTVLGRGLRLSGRSFTIVGVMPRGFSFVDPKVRFWIPLAFTPQQKTDDARHSNGWFNIGRLKPGAMLEQAQTQVNALNAANLERFPLWKEVLINAGFHTTVERLQDMLVRGVKGTLYLLWGGAAFVLLIGAVNIANLALARSGLRRRELATRMALGAGRAQVARQLLVESVLVAGAGGLAGLAFGSAILSALRTIGLERMPRMNDIHMDGTVVGFTMAVSVLIGALIGLAPVAHLFSVNLSALLHEEGRTGTGGRKARATRRGLVVAQVAFAFVLLVGAGLLLASFRRLLAVDPGFKPEGVMTAAVGLPRARYAGDPELRTFTTRALDAIRGVPGVAAAGATTLIPLGGDHSDSVILAEGYVMKPGESLVSPLQVIVTPGYFEAMGTPLKSGRYFDQRDNETAPGAVIVDERLARKFWPGADPIGRRMYKPSNPKDLLKIDKNTRWLTVVGVTRLVRLEDLAEKETTVGAYYFPYAQTAQRTFVFAIKTAGNPAGVMPSVRAELARIDHDLPLYDVRSMTERADLSLNSRRVAMLLALSFGAVALFLSAVGIYGVLAYLVAQRTREIGIRIALGSTAGGVFRLVLREGAALGGSGLALGLAGAFALRRALENQIYGVGPTDPVVLCAVMAALATIALAASILPARRATRVDPVVALNQQ
jgi:predicted permease